MALKVHPVHGGFPVNDRALYPAYEICQSAGLPVIVHCGTSTFPGASNRFGDPILLDDVLRDFRALDVVLAHGGRGWWYDAAAFLALSNERVWIELSGLPPSRLQAYYARHNWARLTRRMIFATDWPGIPGIATNARAVAALCPDDETADLVLAGNADPGLPPQGRRLAGSAAGPGRRAVGRVRDRRGDDHLWMQDRRPLRVRDPLRGQDEHDEREHRDEDPDREALGDRPVCRSARTSL